jgi:hypothetical protein
MMSEYLMHLDREERIAMPLLWVTCSDEQIFGAVREFVGTRTPADQLHDLITQAPALTPHERAGLVRSMMRGSATPAESIFAHLANVLSPEALDRLRADVTR